MVPVFWGAQDYIFVIFGGMITVSNQNNIDTFSKNSYVIGNVLLNCIQSIHFFSWRFKVQKYVVVLSTHKILQLPPGFSVSTMWTNTTEPRRVRLRLIHIHERNNANTGHEKKTVGRVDANDICQIIRLTEMSCKNTVTIVVLQENTWPKYNCCVHPRRPTQWLTRTIVNLAHFTLFLLKLWLVWCRL